MAVVARRPNAAGVHSRMRSQVSESMFDVADTDRDGNLSPAEFFECAVAKGSQLSIGAHFRPKRLGGHPSPSPSRTWSRGVRTLRRDHPQANVTLPQCVRVQSSMKEAETVVVPKHTLKRNIDWKAVAPPVRHRMLVRAAPERRHMALAEVVGPRCHSAHSQWGTSVLSRNIVQRRGAIDEATDPALRERRDTAASTTLREKLLKNVGCMRAEGRWPSFARVANAARAQSG